MFTQLRDVLAAKNSTIMAKKDYRRRRVPPQRAEADFALVGIRQDDIRERFAQRWCHLLNQYTEGVRGRTIIISTNDRSATGPPHTACPRQGGRTDGKAGAYSAPATRWEAGLGSGRAYFDFAQAEIAREPSRPFARVPRRICRGALCRSSGT